MSIKIIIIYISVLIVICLLIRGYLFLNKNIFVSNVNSLVDTQKYLNSINDGTNNSTTNSTDNSSNDSINNSKNDDTNDSSIINNITGLANDGQYSIDNIDPLTGLKIMIGDIIDNELLKKEITKIDNKIIGETALNSASKQAFVDATSVVLNNASTTPSVFNSTSAASSVFNNASASSAFFNNSSATFNNASATSAVFNKASTAFNNTSAFYNASAAFNASVDAAKTIAKQAADNAAKAIVKQIADDTAKALLKTADDAAKTIAKQAADDAAKTIVKQIADDTAKALLKTADDAAKALAKQAADDAAKAIVKQIADDTAKALLKTADDAAKALAKQALDDAVKAVAEQLADNAAKAIAKQAADDLFIANQKLLRISSGKIIKESTSKIASKFLTKTGTGIINKVAETRNGLILLINSYKNGGKNLIKSAYKIGEGIGRSAVFAAKEIAEQDLMKAGLQTNIAVSSKAASTRAVLAVIIPVGTIVDVLLNIFQGINIAIDAEDPKSNSLLDKWKLISATSKEQINEITNSLKNNNNGNSFTYPSRVGPLDILATVPDPNITKQIQQFDDGEIIPGQTILTSLIITEFGKVMSDETIPIIKTMVDGIMDVVNKGGSSDDIDNFVDKYMETNNEQITARVMSNICITNGGIMTNDISPICMYTKENCKNIEKPPKALPECNLTPDPNEDMCVVPGNKQKKICPNPNLILDMSDYDIGKEWSEKRQQCMAINNGMKTMCDANKMKYDIDTDLCIITDEMCKEKTGTSKILADGTLDCSIPVGQSIAEAIFGKSLTNSLIQIFDTDQYETCKDGWEDGEILPDITLGNVPSLGHQIGKYFCKKKCNSGETKAGSICTIDKPKIENPVCDLGYNYDGAALCNAKNVTTTLTTQIPNKCPDGYKLVGLGPMCVAKNCKEGDTSVDLLCRTKCMDGFHDVAGVCWSDKKEILILPNRDDCVIGYKFDNISTCWMTPSLRSRGTGIIPDKCSDNFNNVAGVCWEKCPAGSTDKGGNCEICPDGMKNNGATLCYSSCDSGYIYDGTKMCNFNPVTVGAGIVPNICPDGYNFFGGRCYKKTCETGYAYDNQMTCVRQDKKLSAGAAIITTCPNGWNNAGLLCNEPIRTDTCGKRSATVTTGGDPMPGCGGDCGIDTRDLDTCCDCGGDALRGGLCWSKGSFPKRRGCARQCQMKTDKCCNNAYKSPVITTGNLCLPVTTGGSVTSANISCPNGKNKIGSLCFDNCDDGYQYNTHGTIVAPVSCVPNNDKGPIYTQNDSKGPQCGNDRDMIDGLCYSRCSTGLSRVPGAPTQCQGLKGIIYATKTETPKLIIKKSHPADCQSDKELNGGLCYSRCSDKFGDCYRPNPDAITECYPRKGISYRPDINGCPSGYVDNGLSMCANNYVPKTYAKNSIAAECSGDYDRVLASCYKKCPTIQGNDGIDIQLKHQVGLPTQCVPPRGANYPALKLLYSPEQYPKKRKIKMSAK